MPITVLTVGHMYRANSAMSIWTSRTEFPNNNYIRWLKSTEVFLLVAMASDDPFSMNQLQVLTTDCTGWIFVSKDEVDRMLVEVTSPCQT